MKPGWMNSLALKVMVAHCAGVALTIVTLMLALDAVTTWRGPLFVDEDIAEFAEELGEKLVFDAAGQPTGFDPEGRRREWMFAKLEDPSFLADVRPLLSADEAGKFDDETVQAAFSLVFSELIKRIPGKPWAQSTEMAKKFGMPD